IACGFAVANAIPLTTLDECSSASGRGDLVQSGTDDLHDVPPGMRVIEMRVEQLVEIGVREKGGRLALDKRSHVVARVPDLVNKTGARRDQREKILEVVALARVIHHAVSVRCPFEREERGRA